MSHIQAMSGRCQMLYTCRVLCESAAGHPWAFQGHPLMAELLAAGKPGQWTCEWPHTLVLRFCASNNSTASNSLAGARVCLPPWKRHASQDQAALLVTHVPHVQGRP